MQFKLGRTGLVIGGVVVLCSSFLVWNALWVPRKQAPSVSWDDARHAKHADPAWVLGEERPETNAEAAEALRGAGAAGQAEALRTLSEWSKLQGREAPRRDPWGALWGDALQALGMGGSGAAPKKGPVYAGPKGAPQDECAAVLNIPKVALLFLTRGVMHHEATWAAWFRNAAGLVPLAALRGTGCSPAALEAVAAACAPPGGIPGGPIQQQHLASVYLHVGSNEAGFQGFAPGSVFHGLDIAERLHVEWGTFSLVEATRALFRAALQDRSNAKFMLLSESGIPLYPLQTLWVELLWEAKSRIAACDPEQYGWEEVMKVGRHRWIPAMERDGGITEAAWRKSGQWVTLNRRHVELIVNDTAVAEGFTKHCFVEWIETGQEKRFRDCYADEHYFATLLALRGVERETDCKGETVHVTWRRWGDAHPASWTREEITADKFREFRQTRPAPQCDAAAAVRSAAQQLVAVAELGSSAHSACSRVPPPFAATLGANCTLVARKFAPEVAAHVAALLASCEHGLYIVNSEESCRRERAQKEREKGKGKEKAGPDRLLRGWRSSSMGRAVHGL